MRIVLAPDSFKGSLTAEEACMALEKGIKRAASGAQIKSLPVADGGEGTAECIHAALSGVWHECVCTLPLGSKGRAKYLLLDGRTAVIELAAASGLTLLNKNERDPLKATTIGTGELICDAVQNGAKNIVVTLGGSATCDGGAGILHAMGARFYDKEGRVLYPCGENLVKIKRADTAGLKKFENISFNILCDVFNPLCGENGAAAVFAPQKGADENAVLMLEEGLYNLAKIIDFPVNTRCSGAAGGAAMAFMRFFDAKVEQGIDYILKVTGFHKAAGKADLIITGEGRTDGQSISGKVVSGVAKAAAGKKVIVISGGLGPGYEKLRSLGISDFYSLCGGGITAEYSMKNAARLLEQKAYEVIKSMI